MSMVKIKCPEIKRHFLSIDFQHSFYDIQQGKNYLFNSVFGTSGKPYDKKEADQQSNTTYKNQLKSIKDLYIRGSL